MEITLKVSRTQGFLPGTCGWLAEQLKALNCELKVGTTQSNKAACFLKFEKEGKRYTKALAIRDYFGYSNADEIETYPFPDDMNDFYYFDGVKLTSAASEEFRKIVQRAEELLIVELERDDKNDASLLTQPTNLQ